MRRAEVIIDATPDRVFEVLSDPLAYEYWVVGSSRIRSADPRWPKPGSAFHHVFGAGPLKVRDHSYVEEADAPVHLKLRVKARPLGTARVSLDLQPVDGGTRVTMAEDPGDPLTRLLFNPVGRVLVRLRNEHSLERLRKLVEGEEPIPRHPLPAPDADDRRAIARETAKDDAPAAARRGSRRGAAGTTEGHGTA